MGKRLFLSVLLPVLLNFGLLAEGAQGAGSAPRMPAVQAMTGEALTFDIAFLWFDRLAEGRLTLSPAERPNTYKAVLEARTLGLAAWLTREREHHYETVMELGEDRRFRSISHEARIVQWRDKTPQRRIKRYLFDEAAQQVQYQRIREGELRHDEVLSMAEHGPAADILTVAYNFRAGVYGPLKPGSHFLIPTFSHKGLSYITVDILSERERRKQSFFPNAGGVVCRVQVDPEIFETGNGILHVWLDEQRRPARSIVEKVIGIGTVRGIMR
jgi:hypothetical protein